MYVALIADRDWLDEELSGFHHLVVGLIDEQVRVAQVVPQTLSLSDSSLFGERVLWRESRWSLLNRYKLSRLQQTIEELGVTLLHALDARLWPGAAALARQTGLPAIFSANSAADLKLLPRLLHGLEPTRIALTGSTEPMVRAMREELGPDLLIELNPPGAHLDQTNPPRERAEALCAVVTGNGRLDDAYRALLTAIDRFIRRYPQAQFFFDGHRSDQHQLWRAASELNLLGNLSMIPHRLGHRELLTRADVLLQPQSLGRSHSLVLEAMAHGVPVIAQADPWQDYLIENETAWVLEQPDANDWQRQLDRLIESPQDAQSLGRRAQSWVREHRLASQQIARLLDLYRRMTGETIKFPA